MRNKQELRHCEPVTGSLPGSVIIQGQLQHCLENIICHLRWKRHTVLGMSLLSHSWVFQQDWCERRWLWTDLFITIRRCCVNSSYCLASRTHHGKWPLYLPRCHCSGDIVLVVDNLPVFARIVFLLWLLCWLTWWQQLQQNHRQSTAHQWPCGRSWVRLWPDQHWGS